MIASTSETAARMFQRFCLRAAMAARADRLSVRGRWLGGTVVLLLAMAAAKASIPAPSGPATQASGAAPPPLLLG
ncbi:MAG: hypothetical protein ACK516_02690, partial [Cyanobium sp.]